jgi:hypothetical protein
MSHALVGENENVEVETNRCCGSYVAQYVVQIFKYGMSRSRVGLSDVPPSRFRQGLNQIYVHL